MPDLPWRDICEYLLATETGTDPESFLRRSLDGLRVLIPHDSACFGFFSSDPNNARIEWMEAFGLEDRYVQAYLGYYNRLDSLIPTLTAAGRVAQFDAWQYRRTEFYTDYIAPQRIRFGLGLLLNDANNTPVASLALQRTSGAGFSEREIAMTEVIQTHLNTVFSLLVKLGEANGKTYAQGELPGHRPLSRREAEVASLFCLGLTAYEIAVKLKISPLTVRKHIENSYEKLGVRNRRELTGRLTGSGNGS